MALKFDIASIAFLVLITLSTCQCGGHGGGGHKVVKIEVPYKIHTVHHHHTETYPVIKKIEIPTIKEVKVPYPVHYPVKVPYPVIVKPHVVTVPVHHYPVHTSEHKHHHETHHETHSEGHHDEESIGHHDDSGHLGGQSGGEESYGGGHEGFGGGQHYEGQQHYEGISSEGGHSGGW